MAEPDMSLFARLPMGVCVCLCNSASSSLLRSGTCPFLMMILIWLPSSHLPTPGQRGHSFQRHTAAGTTAYRTFIGLTLYIRPYVYLSVYLFLSLSIFLYLWTPRGATGGREVNLGLTLPELCPFPVPRISISGLPTPCLATVIR